MSTANEFEYNFFMLLMQIPVINTGVRIGHKVYKDIKRCNPYVNTTLETTEQTIDYVKNSETIAKIHQRMGKPLMVADSLACNGLKIVEMKYPFILVAPEHFKVEAWKRMDDLKVYGGQKFGEMWQFVDEHKHVAIEKLYHYLDILIGSKVSFYVDLLDKKVDHFMPSDSQQSDSETEDQKDMFGRVAGVASKIKNRISKRYHRLVLKVMWNHD